MIPSAKPKANFYVIPDKSADEQVSAILTETRRREKVWKKMEAAAREAVEAVDKVAKKKGIKNRQEWMKESNRSKVYIHYTGSDTHNINIDPSGAIDLPYPRLDLTYDGYPKMTDRDPVEFKKAAVEKLIKLLNKYLKEQGR